MSFLNKCSAAAAAVHSVVGVVHTGQSAASRDDGCQQHSTPSNSCTMMTIQRHAEKLPHIHLAAGPHLACLLATENTSRSTI